MILYHGTITQFIPSIEKQGLKPTPHNAFDLINPQGAIRDIDGKANFLCLTPHKIVAEWFANYRAQYSRTQWHGIVAGNQIKLGKQVIPDAKPALLQVTIPGSIVEELKPDKASNGLRFYGTIPASMLKTLPVPNKPLDSDYWLPVVNQM